MEIREEYRPVIKREFTAHEIQLWSFKTPKMIHDVLAIKKPSTEHQLYSHSQIDEESEGFYKSSDANYFTKRFQKQIEKEQTWGSYLTNDGAVLIKPLDRYFYWQAREVVKKYFLKTDPLWSYYDFENDEEAFEDLMRILKDWLTAAQSVVAINQKTKQIHGVALGCYNDGTYLSKKITQVQVFNDKVMEVMNLRRYLQKKITSTMKFFNKEYYQIELLCTDDVFPAKQVPSLLRGLINGSLNVAKELNAFWVFGLSSQKIHDDAFIANGFTKETSLPLYAWLKGEVHFGDFKNIEESHKVTVFVREMAPDPNLKWQYYTKMHDEMP